MKPQSGSFIAEGGSRDEMVIKENYQMQADDLQNLIDGDIPGGVPYMQNHSFMEQNQGEEVELRVTSEELMLNIRPNAESVLEEQKSSK